MIHDHGHRHHHHGGGWHRVRHVLTPHSHDAGDRVDASLAASRTGMRVLWWSFAVLAVTAAIQGAVVAWSGSVALLGDTVHNLGDALTAVPLGIAFVLGRRAASRRFTWGLGRAEDLAGLAILLVIAASAAFAAAEAVDRLIDPRDMRHAGAVGVAALIGFAGNEAVARWRIAAGRRIGSAALVADGLHARADGFTSLAVLLAAGGAALGWRWADPVAGLGIAAGIAAVLAVAVKEVFGRMLDAVDPALVDRAHAALRATPRVTGVERVRLRWLGHSLHAEAEIAVPGTLRVDEAHRIAHDAEHALIHALPRLVAATIHTHPENSAEGGRHSPVSGSGPF
ncbi:cation diffusion facilitator family transporter [Catenuloplanes atrovinosus]|uniref:Cation diffusion facilitator family transporter n=1 Tax=Catenuloplanes atrovinosus TaxID=137266 RepID=A0AAE3YLX8_9ACTN|nr:cation diffusion facilitator family transporter [Catenuloplanes atrovinosus]MDR7274741.1 cation diffusion facilitator family transporter [Catenuloplanes atrovinosus]